MNKNAFLTVLFTTLTVVAWGQQKTSKGPIIAEFGGVYQVADQDFELDTNGVFKVVFDVGRTFEANDRPNPLIETAARFLNMHAQNGVKPENMKVALVVHGSASQDILTDKAYHKKHGIDNPNTPLIKALNDAGVDIILCGQTAGYRNITRSDALREVKFALSAMTALIQLQNNEYRLINF